MDKILREIVEQAYEEARLGRDRDFVDKNRVFSEALAELESEGDAMRYLDSKGSKVTLFRRSFLQSQCRYTYEDRKCRVYDAHNTVAIFERNFGKSRA